ncbi:MAG: helix-turn-helix transcriptional regulator [Bacteroidales bacterium]
MDPIYNYSLCAALPLMLFFGFYFLFARTPEKAIFDNFLRSRRIMGAAMLLLAANYSVHFFMKVRFNDADAAILMNLSTYFLCYWLFSSAITTLLDRKYITRRRLLAHMALWVLYSASSCIVLKLLPEGTARTVAILALAVWLVVYGLFLTWRLLRTYHRVIRIFNETHADDIGAYIKWLSVFTYWAVIFGVGCGLLTFLPDQYVYIWILMSIPFYIFLFLCYLNYMLFYEQVENAMDVNEELDHFETEPMQDAPSYHAEIAERIKGWVNADGYVRTGLTIKDLSEQFHTNRTYLSEFINATYGVSFRDWITGLRIEYAKRLLVQYPKLTLADISERSGFLSPSHFIRIFKENAGCTPARWRKVRIQEQGQQVKEENAILRETLDSLLGRGLVE